MEVGRRKGGGQKLVAFLSKDERKSDERNEALLNLLVKYRLHVLSTA